MVILGRRDRQRDKEKEERDLFFNAVNHDNQIFASKKPRKRPVIKNLILERFNFGNLNKGLR